MIQYFDNFFLSLNFLTVFPVGRNMIVTEKKLGESTACFPFVGAVIGTILVLSNMLLSTILPASISDVLTLIILFFITGGLHMDGLADSADAFMGGNTKEKILAIMKDSRIGSHGAAVVCFFLILKYFSLNGIAADSKMKFIFLMVILGRWSVPLLGSISKYAGHESGLGKAFVTYTGVNQFIKATFFTVIVIIPLCGFKGIFLLLTTGSVTGLVAWIAGKKINGITGDIFGATIELCELTTLISAYFI